MSTTDLKKNFYGRNIAQSGAEGQAIYALKKVALHNLGCKVNACEMEEMAESLKSMGFQIVAFDEVADFYIVNTCTVTQVADKKSRQMLHRARALNPDAVVVAAGCYVNIRGEEEIKKLGVDLAVPNNRKREIPDLLKLMCSSGQNLATELENIKLPSFSDGLRRGKRTLSDDLTLSPEGHTRCFVKVQDGCNMYCSYCIIPYARGKIKSEPIESIKKKVAERVEKGYREFVLTGIHLSSFGMDRKAEKEDLLSLVRALSGIPGVERIRLGSLEPRIVTDEFVKGLSEIPEICPHFHLSLQSGCDEVLRRMNRHYGTEDYINAVERLRTAFDRPALTADVIVGFPGETEDEFMETYAFLEKIELYETHIFKYSRRYGTVAAGMKGQVYSMDKLIRAAQLKELDLRHRKSFSESFLDGRIVELLPEQEIEIEGKRYLKGYTREYVAAAVPVEFASLNVPIAGRLKEVVTITHEHMEYRDFIMGFMPLNAE